MSQAEAKFVDLHTHSTASDGSRPPREVVGVAHGLGLSAIALTDHDTVDGVADAQAEGVSLGIRVIAGVELSAVEGESETHLLGLHLREDRGAGLAPLFDAVRLVRRHESLVRVGRGGMGVVVILLDRPMDLNHLALQLT